MCGRYYRTGDKQALAEYFRAEPVDGLPDFPPAYNIPPTSTEPVIRQQRESGSATRREIVAMRWGLVGFGSQGPSPKLATFNARAEGLERSTLWRRPLHKQRCLIPISGYYEWAKVSQSSKPRTANATNPVANRVSGEVLAATERAHEPIKTPYRFTLANQPFYALAGLWDAWRDPAQPAGDSGGWLQSMSIITVAANAVMSPYHDRMPAILHPRDYDEWLSRDEVERPPVHLLRPYTGSDMQIHEAHAKVGSVRNTGIEMLNSQ